MLVRFSGTDRPTWRRAVARLHRDRPGDRPDRGHGCVLAAAAVKAAPRLAFLALGLILPGLLLQDSWRYSFFALGQGSKAFVNDTVWTLTLVPAAARC